MWLWQVQTKLYNYSSYGPTLNATPLTMMTLAQDNKCTLLGGTQTKGSHQ